MKSVLNRVVVFALVILAFAAFSGTIPINEISSIRADYTTDYAIVSVDSDDSFQSRVDTPDNDIGNTVSPHCGWHVQYDKILVNGPDGSYWKTVKRYTWIC